MTKYILIETVEVEEINPYWYEGCGRLENRTIRTYKNNVSEFENDNKLAEYLATSYAAKKRYKVYEVLREVTPVLETRTFVKFK